MKEMMLQSSPARLDQSGHGPSDESCLHSGVAPRRESEKPIKNSGGGLWLIEQINKSIVNSGAVQP